MAKKSEWRAWKLTGLAVTQLKFDYAFHLHLWSLERDLLLTLATEFVLRNREGNEIILEPERSEELASLLSLLHRPAERFAASSEGLCLLEFEDGVILKGQPHADYEAWQSVGDGELKSASLLCIPGGGSPWG